MGIEDPTCFIYKFDKRRSFCLENNYELVSSFAKIDVFLLAIWLSNITIPKAWWNKAMVLRTRLAMLARCKVSRLYLPHEGSLAGCEPPVRVEP